MENEAIYRLHCKNEKGVHLEIFILPGDIHLEEESFMVIPKKYPLGSKVDLSTLERLEKLKPINKNDLVAKAFKAQTVLNMLEHLVNDMAFQENITEQDSYDVMNIIDVGIDLLSSSKTILEKHLDYIEGMERTKINGNNQK